MKESRDEFLSSKIRFSKCLKSVIDFWSSIQTSSSLAYNDIYITGKYSLIFYGYSYFFIPPFLFQSNLTAFVFRFVSAIDRL